MERRDPEGKGMVWLAYALLTMLVLAPLPILFGSFPESDVSELVPAFVFAEALGLSIALRFFMQGRYVLSTWHSMALWGIVLAVLVGFSLWVA